MGAASFVSEFLPAPDEAMGAIGSASMCARVPRAVGYSVYLDEAGGWSAFPDAGAWAE